MIDRRELRIGNWVELRGENRKIDEKLLYNFQPYYSNPIPLTPEILLAAGFTGKMGVDNYYIIPDPDFPDDPEAAIGDFSIYIAGNTCQAFTGFGNTEYHFGKQFKYLHQLQNFVFALTQTELTINLK